MSRDTSFYYSFLVLPPRKRSAIIAVWDFCRAVDDAVDEVAPGPTQAAGSSADALAHASSEIERWRLELAAVYTGSPTTPQGAALQPYARLFDLPREQFEELISGVEMDVTRTRYRTFAELAEYCRRVAASVGLICLEIFGCRSAKAKAYAENLGTALQLTNIIRDVRSDLERGRIYLPVEDLERFGVTEGDLRAGVMTPPVTALLQFECERAHYYYRRAALELPQDEARSLLAAEIMGAIYFAILRRIERRGYDVFGARVRVPRPRRAILALRLWTATMLGLRSTRLAAQREP